MWEPVKHLRITLQTVNLRWKQTYGKYGVSPTEGGVNFIVWSWSCFHAFYLIRSNLRKWFVSQIMDSLPFAQHLEAYLMLGLWLTCLRYDDFFLMLETEESISEIDGHHILQEASELWSSQAAQAPAVRWSSCAITVMAEL